MEDIWQFAQNVVNLLPVLSFTSQGRIWTSVTMTFCDYTLDARMIWNRHGHTFQLTQHYLGAGHSGSFSESLKPA